MKTMLAAAFLVLAPAAYAADDTKAADKSGMSQQQAADQSYQEEKAQEKALKEGTKWTK